MERTITMKDLVKNSNAKHGNPIMGIGSKAAVDAIIDYASSVKDREAFVAFGKTVAAALRNRMASYADSGKSSHSAGVKMTNRAIADLDGFLATFTVAVPAPVVAAPQPEAPKVTPRMTKADLMAHIEFLTAQLAAR